jgi:hypothetical protein
MLRMRHDDVADEGTVVSLEAFEPWAELGWELVDDAPDDDAPERFEVTAADVEAAAAAETTGAHPLPPDGDRADDDPED